MCLTLLQELKGRLYFEDSSDSNCVNSIILLNCVYLFFLSIYNSWQSESKKDAYFWFCWHF